MRWNQKDAAAKHWSGEQQPHSRRPRGFSKPTSLVVYVAGMGVKANAHTQGGSVDLPCATVVVRAGRIDGSQQTPVGLSSRLKALTCDDGREA